MKSFLSARSSCNLPSGERDPDKASDLLEVLALDIKVILGRTHDVHACAHNDYYWCADVCINMYVFMCMLSSVFPQLCHEKGDFAQMKKIYPEVLSC